MNPTLPHFDLPFRFDSLGHVATVQQDTQKDVQNCVEAILRTELGTRLYVPAFGVADPTFTVAPISLAAIDQQTSKNEPRAQITLGQTVEFLDALITDIIAGVEVRTGG